VSAAVQAYQRSTDAFDDVVAARMGLKRTDLRCLDWLYAPLAREGAAILEGYSDADLTVLREFLVAARALNDRHRSRLRQEAVGTKFAD
jgi:hypothetical protein